MTQDEILEIAKEVYGETVWTEASLARLQQFVNLVAAKERKACAKVCEQNSTDLSEGDWDSACNNCADLIQARSNT